jgi:hypothetical protein
MTFLWLTASTTSCGGCFKKISNRQAIYEVIWLPFSYAIWLSFTCSTTLQIHCNFKGTFVCLWEGQKSTLLSCETLEILLSILTNLVKFTRKLTIQTLAAFKSDGLIYWSTQLGWISRLDHSTRIFFSRFVNGHQPHTSGSADSHILLYVEMTYLQNSCCKCTCDSHSWQIEFIGENHSNHHLVPRTGASQPS